MRFRKALLAALAAAGYTGAPVAAEVQKFIDENNLEFPQITAAGKSIADVLAEKTVLELSPESDTTNYAERRSVQAAAERTNTNATAANLVANAGLAATTERKALTPAQYRRIGERKAYDRRAASGQTVFGSADEAEGFAASVRLMVAENPRIGNSAEYADQKRADMEIVQKVSGMTTVSPTQGNALTFPEYMPSLIRLVQDYGVSLNVCPSIPMSTGSIWYPRRTGGITPYYPGEGGTITESDPTYNNVVLAAKQGYTLSAFSLQLLQTEAINVADLIAQECATTWALDGDQKFFLGDGTATGTTVTNNATFNSNNFLGWGPAISAVASNLSLVATSGTSYGACSKTDLTTIVGQLPAFPGAKNVWVMHKASYWAFMNLLYGLGGVPAREMTEGPGQRPTLLGYPVYFAQALPFATTNSSTSLTGLVFGFFGDFSLGSKQGDVTGGWTMASSDQRYFDQGLIALRSGRYWGQVIHDPGTSTAAGPVIGIKMA